MTTIAGLRARSLRAEDSLAVIALVERAYAEYPGCVLDLPGVDADLPVLAEAWRDAGGRGWVVEDDDEVVVACVGLTPAQDDAHGARVELKRLYVADTHRRRGLGRALVALVEHHAVADHDARSVELWSDTRFRDAHRLYEGCGYERTGGIRRLHDPSDTTEYHFVHRLGPEGDPRPPGG